MYLDVPAHLAPALEAQLASLARARGLEHTAAAGQARTIVHVREGTGGPATAEPVLRGPSIGALPPDNPEGYAITVAAVEGRTRLELTAPQGPGLRHASRTLAQLWTPAGVPEGRIVDWPAWPVRGVVEGFYGKPWTREQRADMVEFLGAHKFNTFLYAPKNDPFHRDAWRDPYPEGAMAALVEQLRQCRDAGLRFVYALAPGLDMRYSAPGEVDVVCAKFRLLFDAGVRDFGLFFDDIPYVFAHDEDIAAFGEATLEDRAPLGTAHAAVGARVWDVLQSWDPSSSLILCPVEYWGACDSAYVRALRAGLPAGVAVFYTGPDICSARQETTPTRAVSERFGRPVTFWDNYPVNDAAMTGRLHLNPLVGRDPDLYTAARGLFSNPMPQCEASKIALGTIAEYLWAPDTYDPAAAFRRTVASLVEAAEVPHVERFAEHMHSCCLHETEAVALAENIATVRAAWQTAGEAEAAKVLLGDFNALAQTGLACERLSNEALRREMLPWVTALTLWATVGRRALGLLRTPPARRAHERAALEDTLRRAQRLQEETCGGVVADFAHWVLEHVA